MVLNSSSSRYLQHSKITDCLRDLLLDSFEKFVSNQALKAVSYFFWVRDLQSCDFDDD